MGILSKFGFGKKPEENGEAESELTFKQRVKQFWEWYAQVGASFYDTIEDGRCGDLQPAVSAKTQELLPGLSWVFGPGKDDIGHSFTLSPEGNAARQFLTEYWLQEAPKLEGWTFYDARQPGTIEGKAIGIGDQEFKAEAMWITPFVDKENEEVDIVVWHPAFEYLDENGMGQITFLWLDEALGERAVSNRIGKVDFGDENLKGAIPIAELPEFIEQTEKEYEWQDAMGVVYQNQEPSEDGLRQDIFVGSSICSRVIRDYMESGGPSEEDPVEGLGAEFIFVALDRRNLNEDEEDPLAARGELEERITQALDADASGLVIGGGTGVINSYIDLLIFDGKRSKDLICHALGTSNLPYGATIHPFYSSGDPVPIAI